MTTGPSLDFAEKSLQLADEMLVDAELMLTHGRLKSAADRAYYAMFHAAQAALSREIPRLPKSHKGVRTLFAQRFIATNRLERDLSRALSLGFDLRQASSYDVDAAVDESAIRDMVNKAKTFVLRI